MGRSDGINTASDIKIVEELRKKGADVIPLIQPTHQELNEALWNKQGYHIFIFTGHSRSHVNGQIGWIKLNNEDDLSIEDFKNALKESIDNGLQLAIFNSCDGLGLAYQLAQLNLPRSIVMREPVPDPVAIDFLKEFFAQFTDNNSLFTSVRIARKRLEHFNSKYAGVMWLPTICVRQSALENPLTWQGLCHKSDQINPIAPKNNPNSILAIGKVKLVGGMLGLIAVGISLGLILPRRNVQSQSIEIGLNTRTNTQVHCPDKSTPNQQNTTQKSAKHIQCLADVPNVPHSIVWLDGGSTSWAEFRPIIKQRLKQIFDIDLNTRNPGGNQPDSGHGIEMLKRGEILFAESSRSLTKEDDESRYHLKSYPIAIDAIAIVVNPQLKIPGLKMENIHDIFTGKITNWSQVGGPKQQITIYLRQESSGTTTTFKKQVLKGNKFGAHIFVKDTSEAVNKVAQDEGGIYFASAPEVVLQCKVKSLPIFNSNKNTFVAPYQSPLILPQVCPKNRNKLNIDAIKNGDYPIIRHLFLIVKQDGGAAETAGETFKDLLLTGEGQDLIKKAYWVPIN